MYTTPQISKFWETRFLIMVSLILIFPDCIFAQNKNTQVTNFSDSGAQVTKFSKLGDAIDAHDGEIAYFDGVYYLYGTSYGCGFEWGKKDAPFCGFKVYSSKDLVNWKDGGELFDASTAIWQSRCNGNTYGCFRPHVIYNKKTSKYVLWINVYDNSVGYRVFTSNSPAGPFVEQAEPRLVINRGAPVAGLNNGDHDTFVDDDGRAYIACTDWRAKGAIVVEQLSADYLTGTGKVTKPITPSTTEAPALFKRKGIYYLVYSDPNCGYCSGTGASYRTAPSPMGPWSEGIKISENSCGGQPSFVSTIKLKTGEIFLFGSDLWNNAAKNESLANYYWAPLTFAPDGSINKIECDKTFSVYTSGDKRQVKAEKTSNFKSVGDIDRATKRSQTFLATSDGLWQDLSISCFKNHYPNADLIIEISTVPGQLLKSMTIPVDSISWSPKNMLLHPGIKVQKGKHYSITVSTKAAVGCYGLQYYLQGGGKASKKFLYRTGIIRK
ncbi:MAG TPA: family 43 glycosylhydrolase [Arachidicoccus sp.]|nr:family 43 glycosylhydrolase [Arachidicoccus sp.]